MAGSGILEKDIQKTILKWLRYQKRVFVWRQNSGASYRPYKGENHFYRQQDIEGVSDIIGVWDGRPLAIEVKRLGEKPTENQHEFLTNFAKAGGVAICAHSLEEVQRSMKQVLDETVGFQGIYIRNL